MSRYIPAVAVILPLLALSACSANKEYHYWQQKDPTSAIYLSGPKAQQMLEEDIAECVHEIIELDKLQVVRDGKGRAPTLAHNYSQKAEAEKLSKLPGYDVPEYIRSLRVEHKNFQDFDGCMRYNGWERVKYVSPETEARSRAIYERPADYETRPEAAQKVAAEPSDAMTREEEALKRR